MMLGQGRHLELPQLLQRGKQVALLERLLLWKLVRHQMLTLHLPLTDCQLRQ
jgi:hypothetical protein